MSTSSNRARGAAAVELLRTLYPAPLRVVVGSAATGSTRAEWLALPTARGPRLLVATRSSRAAVRSLRRQLVGQRSRTRATRLVTSFGVATGIPMRLASLRIAVTGPSDAPCIEDPLKEVLGVGDLCITMPVGPARANRKPVLQITDVQGRVLAFAKVGHNELTKRLVRHESAALARLSGSGLESVRTPKLLATAEWRDLAIAVMEPLDIPAHRLRGEPARQRLLAVVRDVADVAPGPAVAWSEHPHRGVLEAGAASCGVDADRISGLLAGLDADVAVTSAAWHGDLNSGNVAIVADRCPVWDWERFGDQVPVGFDLLHHDLQQAVAVERRDPQAVAESILSGAPAALSPFGVDADAADLSARAYLLTLAQRYLADQQDDAGAPLGRVADWLLPALERHVPNPTRGR